MTATRETLILDGLTLEVRRSPRRATVGIIVDRAGDLIVHLPDDCPLAEAAEVVQAKQLWIYTKLAQKDRLAAPPRTREYVTGEGFFYLGRSYCLRLVPPEDAPTPLRLYQGRFALRRDAAEQGRRHFVRWYRGHALPWATRRIALLAPRVEVAPRAVTILSLGNRWGSCTPEGALNFHWRAILLPGPIAEYIVAHELVHLQEHHHSPAFWQRLERVMPDYAARQLWLAEHGAHYDL